MSLQKETVCKQMLNAIDINPVLQIMAGTTNLWLNLDIGASIAQQPGDIVAAC